VTKNIVA